jgi:hypothetical protein
VLLARSLHLREAMRRLVMGTTGGLLLVALLAGCGPGSSGPVKGRIDGAPQGTTVSASWVEGDGSLTGSSAEVAVDAGGRYRLMVALERGKPLMIRARSGAAAQGSVAIDGIAGSDGDIFAAPIDARSTVRADVMLWAKVTGQWDEASTVAGLRRFFPSELAAAVAGSADYAGDMRLAAKAAVAGMDAWQATLAAQGCTRPQLEAAAAGCARAEAGLEERLDAASDEAMVYLAGRAFVDADEAAYVDAGVARRQLAAASVAGADAMRVYLGETSSAARPAGTQEAERVRARFVTRAVEELLVDAGGADAGRQAVLYAGRMLETGIAIAARAGAEVDQRVEAEWAVYGGEVTAQIETALRGRIDSFAGLEEAISEGLVSLAAARGALSASAPAWSTAQAASAAIGRFHAGVLDEQHVLVQGGVGEARATAALEALAVVNACGAGK